MRTEHGFSLIEVLVATAIIASVGVAIFSGLTLTTKLLTRTNTDETAKELAVSQMEYVKNTWWSDTSYNADPNVTPPSGYSIPVITPVPMGSDGNLQRITVIVKQNNRVVFRLEDYKVK
jgi:prepilin-type N-terminal cleavage/methylation domain-containing protein